MCFRSSDDLTDGSNESGSSPRGNKRLHDDDDSTNEDNRFPPRTHKRVSVINIFNHLEFSAINLGLFFTETHFKQELVTFLRRISRRSLGCKGKDKHPSGAKGRVNITLSTAPTKPHGPVHPPMDSPVTEADIPVTGIENEILPHDYSS